MFEDIQVQKNIFLNLFTEIANQFPQSILIQAYKNSKGTKVSQGINLENCPYQVLDICRDFDSNSGFNIRILNWWGHGLYILVQFGKITAEKQLKRINDKFKKFYVGLASDAFDYPAVFISDHLLSTVNLDEHIRKFGHLLIFDKITYSESINVIKFELLEKIKFILDK
ncbi:hypothetical protein MM236_03905 [Belliella sp. DSM 107340]|uniref:Uncharacterized protein n=1 Tax=Belliella calami TaxID=2923436 RepID=A0ABS9UKH0_9BACT|nr:hypothetical protein [Belliella calami]MCH7397115.1 hypothetical protein [Belliella calami]